jgi:cell division protein ZapA
MSRTVELRVAGHNYRVVSSLPEADLQRLAGVVSHRLTELAPHGRLAVPQAFLLAAIALAHEAEEERGRAAALAQQVEDERNRAVALAQQVEDERGRAVALAQQVDEERGRVRALAEEVEGERGRRRVLEGRTRDLLRRLIGRIDEVVGTERTNGGRTATESFT